MKNLRFLFVITLMMQTAMASFTKEDIEAEVAQLRHLREQSFHLLQPIQDEITFLKKKISAPFDCSAQFLITEIDQKTEKVNQLYAQLHEQEHEHQENLNTLKVAQESEIDEETAALRKELKAKQEIILPKIQSLKEQKKKILENCYKNKADSQISKLWDGIDSFGVGLNLGLIEEQIKVLYQSVEGDLPDQIKSIEQKIIEGFSIMSTSLQEDYQQEKQKIEQAIQEQKSQEEELRKKISDVYRQRETAVREELPDLDLVEHLVEDVLILELLGHI